MALTGSRTHVLLLLFALSHSPRWLFEGQPWCQHSRQHNRGRKGAENKEPQQSTFLLWNLPIQHLPLISHCPAASHRGPPSCCLIPVPKKRKEEEDGPTPVQDGQCTASDDFAIHFCFQAVLMAGENNSHADRGPHS